MQEKQVKPTKTREELSQEHEDSVRRKEQIVKNLLSGRSRLMENSVFRHASDLGTSFIAGAAKMPSDILQIPFPDAQILKDWENGVNSARDYLQSESLVEGRRALNQLLEASGGEITKEFLETAFTQYPDVAANYVAELGLPIKAGVKAVSKGAKLLRKASDPPELQKAYKLSMPYLALGGLQISSDLNDLNDLGDTESNRQAKEINAASKEFLRNDDLLSLDSPYTSSPIHSIRRAQENYLKTREPDVLANMFTPPRNKEDWAVEKDSLWADYAARRDYAENYYRGMLNKHQDFLTEHYPSYGVDRRYLNSLNEVSQKLRRRD